MPNLTLKNIPDSLLERLRTQAAENRRSINSEILQLLDQALQPRKPDLATLLGEIDGIHARYEVRSSSAAEVRQAIRRGRL